MGAGRTVRVLEELGGLHTLPLAPVAERLLYLQDELTGERRSGGERAEGGGGRSARRGSSRRGYRPCSECTGQLGGSCKC